MIHSKKTSNYQSCSKVLTILLFVIINYTSYAQETLIKSFTSNIKNIEISTDGLDEIKIINSEDNNIEISLFDENTNSHDVLVNEETSILNIGFKLGFSNENDVFRKYITNRINRASVVVKLPKNRNLTILGTNIGIISKSYDGNITIYIDKGFVNLHTVQQNAILKLFKGNVFANLKNSNIDIKSTNGKILINKRKYQKEYKTESGNRLKTFTISSINANVNINTL